MFIRRVYLRSKKKVAWLAIKLPAKFCDAYIKQIIIVRRKSVPLKRSRIPGLPPIWASISTVRCTMANVCWAFSGSPVPRRLMERRASSLRPWRISHQGDSGARKTRIKRGVWTNQSSWVDGSIGQLTGKIHCKARGTRQAHWSFRWL